MESQDLLDYLDVCLDFIDERRKERSVLVHCFAGVSRSAAIVTAYLMRTEQLSQEDALESLRQSCEFVCPNDGFLDQLKMFEAMGFKVDRASSIHKRFRLKLLVTQVSFFVLDLEIRDITCKQWQREGGKGDPAPHPTTKKKRKRNQWLFCLIYTGDSYNHGESIDSSKFGADPGFQTEVSEVESSLDKGLVSTPAYRCKKCRRSVALQDNVVDHIPGEGETSFEWCRRRSGNPFDKGVEIECLSIFIEPLRWMTAVEEGALEGKLSCLHCESRLGYFNWSGIQCSCGSWITPAFVLHKSRVDISAV